MAYLKKSSSKLHGTGLFTTRNLSKGDHVVYIDGPVVVFKKFTPAISKRMLNWIGVSRYGWIDTSNSLFRFINHSCKPNVALVSKRKVIALKNIEANSEITMDYSLTEAEPGWSIQGCTCGSTECRKVIGPINTLPKKIYLKYLPYIPKKFQKIYTADANKI